MNFLCDLQTPTEIKPLGNTLETCYNNYKDLTDIEDFTGNENDPEDEYEELPLTTTSSAISVKESMSAYVGTNYKDEPTAIPDAGDKPPTCNQDFQNSSKRTPLTNGLS